MNKYCLIVMNKDGETVHKSKSYDGDSDVDMMSITRSVKTWERLGHNLKVCIRRVDFCEKGPAL